MLLLTLAPQDEHIFSIVARDLHDDAVNFLAEKLPKLLVVLVILFVLQRAVLFFVHRLRKQADKQLANFHRAGQLRTMASILRATAYGVFGFIAFLQVLNVFDIPYQPLLASAGILGVGIGLGAQSMFKDMITGIFIVVEDQFNVGEVVVLANLKGTVEDLSLRRTTVRDSDGTLYVIPNSQITTVSNLSRDYSVAALPVSVDASANPDKVMEVLRKLADEVRNDPAFRQIAIANPDILGINDIRGREIIYQINIRVRANQRDGVLRELRRRIVLVFEKEGIPLGISSNMLIMQENSHPIAS
jgi:moderate conductance mechanosensitive channel